MNTKTLVTIKGYYDSIQRKNGWQAYVSANIEFN